jgi:hypothetical protein
VDYRADSDIDDIVAVGLLQLPLGLGGTENTRVELFRHRDLILEDSYSRDQQPSDAALRGSAAAAMAVYDLRSESLVLGWRKFAVLQAGLAGIDLDSNKIMEWAYRICKGNSGWLGDFEVRSEREMPLLTMVQEMPPALIIGFRN